ncbi:MAG: GAF domain-containing protein, partial [Anaerolineales bacterium]|nr:GAF domain-containing protein [Anaerolineales bacterium]
KRLAAGDQSVRTGMRYGAGEISQLGRAFDEMAETLQQRETERKRAEEAMRQSEESYRNIFDRATVGIYQAMPEGRYLSINPAMAHIYGYDSSEQMLTGITDIASQIYVDPSRRQEFKRLLSEHEQVMEFTNQHYHRDGSIIWTSTNARVVKDKEGKILFYEGFMTDITERKQAEQALEKRAHELTMLYESAMTISSNLSLDVVLKTVVEQVVKAINTEGCALSFWDQERDILETMVDYRKLSPDKADIPGTTYSLKDYPATRRVLETHQPLFLSRSNPQADPAELALMERLDMGTLLLLPLVARDQVIGLMELYEVANKERVFTEDDIRLAQSLSAQTAIFIDNARLFEQAERRLRRTEALRAIDTAITGNMDLISVFDVIFDQTFTQLGVDAAVILMYDPTEQALKYANERGFRTEALQHTHLPLGEGYAGRVALGRQVIHIPNLQGRKTDFLRSPTFTQEGFISYFGVPLIAKGEIKGVLEVFHRASLEPDTEWLSFLETLAGQAAIAIDNATLFKDLQLSNIELSKAYDATIAGWSHAMDLRDEETQNHTLRVTEMTERLARRMGIGDAELVHIRRGGLLHDIGKMGVPDGILLKPGKLTEEEWVHMRQHPQLAHDMLAPIAYLRPAMDIPYCHHEKWDGTGYPCGLKGEQIPLAARIFAVVDVYDALTSDRPYRKAWTQKKTLEYIRGQAGTHFDPAVADAFLASMPAVPKNRTA